MSARWARSRQRRSERRLSTTSMTATDRTITASEETIAVSIGWLSQNSPITTSEAATATKSKIARTEVFRQPGLGFGITHLAPAGWARGPDHTRVIAESITAHGGKRARQVHPTDTLSDPQ